MLFGKVLLALPFIGAALAYPAPSTNDTPVKRDLDILAVVTDLKASVVSIALMSVV